MAASDGTIILVLLAALDSRSRSSKESVSTLNEESNDSSLQFHLSLNDDIDDGIVSDADDSATEDDDDDQVFRTPVNANSAPSSPATIVSIDLPSPSLQIEVHSVYNDLHQALDHLKKKLIATYTPESMRGGGLLKYCDLLAQNYKVYDLADMCRMQRYMCSRFFIDYKTVPEQIHVITQYVTTHFLPLSMSSLVDPGQPLMECRVPPTATSSHSKSSLVQNTEHNHLVNARLCLLFFDHLLSVIQQSTVCLTHHDKEMTWIHINNLKESYHYKYEHLFLGDHQHFQQYHMYHHHHHQQQQQYHHHCSSSSSNSSRSVGVVFRPLQYTLGVSALLLEVNSAFVSFRTALERIEVPCVSRFNRVRCRRSDVESFLERENIGKQIVVSCR